MIQDTFLEFDKKINIIDEIQKLTLEEYALLSFINGQVDEGNDKINIIIIKELFSNKLDVYKTLKSLEQNNKIKINFKMENNNMIISLTNYFENDNQKNDMKPLKEADDYHKLKKIILLEDYKIKNLSKLNDKELLINSFRLIQKNLDNYNNQEIINIKDEQSYINYLNTVNPITHLLNLNQIFKFEYFEFIFVNVIQKEEEIGKINFLLDYSVNNSIYKNLSIKFAQEILNSWNKNNITNLNEAMQYIKQSKEQQKKYKEPEWEEISQNNKIKEEYNVNELLKKNGLKK